MNENEDYFSFEDRFYANPTQSRDSQLAFVNTLRDVQARNTAQINADTYRLGTQVPSNLGGLGGAENTFVARYQKPQTEQTVADLRTVAQQTALNTALSNLQNAYKKRYNDAMLNYQRRAANGGSGGNGGGGDDGNGDGAINKIPLEQGGITEPDLLETGKPNATPSGAAGTISTRVDDYIEQVDAATGTPLTRVYDDGRIYKYENGKWVRTNEPKHSLFSGIMDTISKTITRAGV